MPREASAGLVWKPSVLCGRGFGLGGILFSSLECMFRVVEKQGKHTFACRATHTNVFGVI